MPFLKHFNNEVKDEVSKQDKKFEKESHEQQKIKLSLDLTSNIETIKKIMGSASDIVVREFTIIPETQIKSAVILIKGLAERELINEQVIGPLMSNDRFSSIKDNIELFQIIKEYGIPNIYVSEEFDVNNIVNELISGNTILLLDKIDKALIVGSSGWKDRAISEPTSENSVRGPKDSFTENIENNTALIRRRIKGPDLRMELFKIGTKTKTTVLAVYLEGIAKKEIIDEVKSRLERIKIDGILESGYIEELIEDTPFSPFPQIEHSERPDKVSAALLEGRVAILVDTTPYALIVPTIFFQFIQSADDYYERFSIGTLTRFIRISAYFIWYMIGKVFLVRLLLG